MNGFKSIFSPYLSLIIKEWFENEFIIIYQSNLMHLVKKYTALPKKRSSIKMENGESAIVEAQTNEAARIFGINSNFIAFVTDDENMEAKMFSFVNGANKAVLSDEFESYGTLRFLNIFPPYIFCNSKRSHIDY